MARYFNSNSAFNALHQTSALDSRTETELMKNINNILLNKARTSIFIAHRFVVTFPSQLLIITMYFLFTRLRTVVESDLIIVMHQGRVIEQGTHQELLEKGGLYYDMWLEQAMDAFSSGEDEGESTEGLSRKVEETK